MMPPRGIELEQRIVKGEDVVNSEKTNIGTEKTIWLRLKGKREYMKVHYCP
jgi:hypothetical protein